LTRHLLTRAILMALTASVAATIAIMRALTPVTVTVAHAVRSASHPVLLAGNAIGLDSAHPGAIASVVVVRRSADREAGYPGDREEGDRRTAGEGGLQRPP
jgi:hypothetical protein